MELNRRRMVGSAFGLALLPAALQAQTARPYPERTITMYHPNPGGALDLAARMIAASLKAAWGQPVIVDTKPGAGGSVAAAFIAKAPPDGHTLVLGGSAIVNNLLGATAHGYALEDLTPVCLVVYIPTGFGVSPSLGVKTMAEYVALARAQPGKLTFGSPGVGSGAHTLAEIVNMTAKINTVHVPYKSETQAIGDLLGGNIDGVFSSLYGLTKYPGKIIPLAVANPSRLPSHPDIPTFTEAGLPDANKPGWATLFAPAKTPKHIVEAIATEVRRTLAIPEVSTKLVEFGFVPTFIGPEKMADFLQNHVNLMRTLQSSGRLKFG